MDDKEKIEKLISACDSFRQAITEHVPDPLADCQYCESYAEAERLYNEVVKCPSE